MEQTTNSTDALQKRTPEEGEVLGMTYNLDGPVQVIWKDGKEVLEQLPKIVPPNWEQNIDVKKIKPFHVEALGIIMSLLEQRRRYNQTASQPITIPILMLEIKDYVHKQTIKELEKMGLIEIKLARFQKNGKLAEAVNVLWLTGTGDLICKQMKESAEVVESLIEEEEDTLG